jgi:hypothetical protein
MQLAQARLKEALAGTASKEKGPPVADGVLSVTPDAPEMCERGFKGQELDSAETDIDFLQDGTDGAPLSLAGHRLRAMFTLHAK